MKYIKIEKKEFAENEYSMEVKRVVDEDYDAFINAGWEPATRQEWEVVQSDEVKAAIANGEYADELVAEVAPESTPEAPVAEEPAQ
jgi:hypothetical protein